MPNKSNYLFLLAALLITLTSEAQTLLTFDQALKQTLASNFDIRMARIDEEVAKNNASKNNNGYLPTVSATGGYNWTFYSGNNQLITGEQPYDANNSYTYNASALVNYTLFDGQGRKFNYLQSVEGHYLSEVQVMQVIENTILELSRIFHEVARLDENVGSLKESVQISKDRLLRLEYGYEYGQAAQLDVLNAKVDLNNDSINLVNNLQELANMKRDLNRVMGQDILTELEVDKTVEIRNDLVEKDVLASAEARNLQLQALDHSMKSSEYAIGAGRSTWLPSINASAGYNYRGSDDPNGSFVLSSSNYGPQAGVSLSWNIFDARNKTTVQNAKLNLQSRMLEKESVLQNIKSQALNAHARYMNTLFVLKAQSDNVATAKSNFERSEESFNLGQITAVEFRQAQLNLLNAEQAVSKAKYDAKNAELQVLALMGTLAGS